MSLYYPANFREFCRVLVPLHGEPGFVPNILKDYVLNSGLTYKPYSYNYELMGYSTTYFIINSGRKILLTFTLFIVTPVAYVIAY
jgi:hypothetical protein